MMRWRAALAALRLSFYFVLFCFCGLQMGLQARNMRENEALPSVGQRASSADQPPLLGTTVELEQSGAHAQQQALARLHMGGLGWVRQRFDWRLLEPAEGRFEWRGADTILSNIGQSGLVSVVVLDGSPAWARDPRDKAPHDNPFAPPADPAAFARFAGAFAARYGSQVRYYQIWHEPNIAPHWGNRHIEPVEYARLLYAAGRAIRAADPDARIVTAALAPTADRGHTAIDEVYFLQRLYAASREFGVGPEVGLLAQQPLFDVVAVEPFGFGTASSDSRQRLAVLNFQRVALVHRAMLAAGDAQTPLWAVRFGWNTHPDSPWKRVSKENQVRFAAQAVAQVHAGWPWLGALGWVVDQPAAPPADPMWGFALNERLLQVLGEQELVATHTEARTAGPSRERSGGLGLQTALLLLLLPLIIWRAHAAWTEIEQNGWPLYGRSVRGGWLYISSWIMLLLLYYVAVWPPLLALCWLGFAVLAWTSPLFALCVTAAAMPFHFQHKEMVIVDWQWQIPPAQMLLSALLPALGRTYSCPGKFRTTSQRVEMGQNFSGQPYIGSPYGWRVEVAGRRLMRLQGWDWLALGWLGVSLASSVNVWHWPAYWAGLADLVLAPLLLYVCARGWATSGTDRRRLALWLFGGGLLATVWGGLSWLQGGGVLADGVQRLVGPHFSPNHTALYLERTLFLGAGLTLSTGGLRKWAGVAACALVACALLLTFSRGALVLGLPAGAIVFYTLVQKSSVPHLKEQRWDRTFLGNYTYIRRAYRFLEIHSLWSALRYFQRIGLGVGCILLGLIFWLFADRLTNSASVVQRLDSWLAAVKLWLDYPLLGVGPNGFFWRYPAYTLNAMSLDPNLRHPHNLWLEFAASWGVAGIGWLLVTLWLLWRRGAARPGVHRFTDAASAWVSAGILAGLAAGLMHGQVDAFMALADLAGWNWLVLALLVMDESG